MFNVIVTSSPLSWRTLDPCLQNRGLGQSQNAQNPAAFHRFNVIEEGQSHRDLHQDDCRRYFLARSTLSVKLKVLIAQRLIVKHFLGHSNEVKSLEKRRNVDNFSSLYLTNVYTLVRRQS